jgi:hypothetical protein
MQSPDGCGGFMSGAQLQQKAGDLSSHVARVTPHPLGRMKGGKNDHDWQRHSEPIDVGRVE